MKFSHKAVTALIAEKSPSAWREWIEITDAWKYDKDFLVSLRMEGVD